MVLLLGNGAGRESTEIYGIVEEKKKRQNMGDLFTVIASCELPKVDKKRGVVIITDNSISLKNRIIPSGFVGICEDKNEKAIEIFESSKIPVITCGMGNKNTVTATSISNGGMLIAAQRAFSDIKGRIIEPFEYKMTGYDGYSSFSVMAAFCIFKIYGMI